VPADDFALVVVLHNSASELARLLESVDRHLDRRPPVVAVDTGSRDAGPQLARKWGAEVVPVGPTTGFGLANNIGMERVRAPVTVLLNPDVVLLDDGVLRLIAAVRKRDVLMVPRLLNADGTVQRSAHPVPGTARALLPALVHPHALPRRVRDAADPWRSGRPRRVGWAIAAALVARTPVLRRLGPFDPHAFMYAEDMDLCLRAADQDIPTVLDPSVALLHIGGHAAHQHFGGEPVALLARRRREVIGARLGPRALALDDTAQAVTFASRALARGLGRRGWRRPAAQLRALAQSRRA
jgi:GT2 family glycosyltransferase